MGRRRNKRKNTSQGLIKHCSQHNMNEFEYLPSTSILEFDVNKNKRDNKGRRIITKEMLYKDPELHETCIEPDSLYKDSNFMKNYGIEWTTPNWLKGGKEEISNYQYSKDVNIPKRLNKLEKRLNKMLAQPVQMTKAEKMMAKMGWDGGALGKNGEGIIEPIAPNATYASSTFGLGKITENLKKPKQFARNQNKKYFKTNVLHSLLEFVMNDSEIEITFDSHLSKHDRKSIHNIVWALMKNGNSTNYTTFTKIQTPIAQKIYDYNRYILNTESNGAPPNRYLCLYKEAPENMYLVTPDDLCLDENEDKSDITRHSQTIQSKIETNDVNIGNNMDLDNDEECTVELLQETIIDCFMEFLENENYTEFRLLGQFTSEEMKAINMFMEKCRSNEFYENNRLKFVCKSKEIVIDIKTNLNGRPIFYKLDTKSIK